MSYYRWRRRAPTTYRPGRYWVAFVLPVAVLAFTLARVLLSKR